MLFNVVIHYNKPNPTPTAPNTIAPALAIIPPVGAAFVDCTTKLKVLDLDEVEELVRLPPAPPAPPAPPVGTTIPPVVGATGTGTCVPAPGTVGAGPTTGTVGPGGLAAVGGPEDTLASVGRAKGSEKGEFAACLTSVDALRNGTPDTTTTTRRVIGVSSRGRILVSRRVLVRWRVLVCWWVLVCGWVLVRGGILVRRRVTSGCWRVIALCWRIAARASIHGICSSSLCRELCHLYHESWRRSTERCGRLQRDNRWSRW